MSSMSRGKLHMLARNTGARDVMVRLQRGWSDFGLIQWVRAFHGGQQCCEPPGSVLQMCQKQNNVNGAMPCANGGLVKSMYQKIHTLQ